MNSTLYRLTLLVAAALLVSSGPAGCAKLNLGEDLDLFASEPKPQTPDSVVAVWTDTVLHQTGKPPVRGFGGRVVFHGGEAGEPILVDGNLIVYAFDDASPDPNNPVPEKKFVFPAENLPEHQSESSLGPSYNFWLPWDKAGGMQRRISLITRFEDVSGSMLASKIAHVTLPGKVEQLSQADAARPAQTTARSAGAPAGVSPVSYEAEVAANNGAQAEAEPRMSTSTIDIAPHHAQRLLKASSSSDSAATAAARGSVSASAAGSLAPAVETLSAPAAEHSSPRASSNAAPAYQVGHRDIRRGGSLRRLPPTPRSLWTRPRTGLAEAAEAEE